MGAKIIGISGKKGAGKDLLGSFLIALGWERKRFAETLKAAVRRDFDLTEDHTDGWLKEAPTKYFHESYGLPGLPPSPDWTPREIMIAYGQFFRQFDKNYWVNKALTGIKDGDRLVITDLRFDNEAKAIKKAGGFLVRLERKPELNIYGPDTTNDISETDLDAYEGFDMRLSAEENLTPKDLEAFAKRIVEAYA